MTFPREIGPKEVGMQRGIGHASDPALCHSEMPLGRGNEVDRALCCNLLFQKEEKKPYLVSRLVSSFYHSPS